MAEGKDFDEEKIGANKEGQEKMPEGQEKMPEGQVESPWNTWITYRKPRKPQTVEQSVQSDEFDKQWEKMWNEKQIESKDDCAGAKKEEDEKTKESQVEEPWDKWVTYRKPRKPQDVQQSTEMEQFDKEWKQMWIKQEQGKTEKDPPDIDVLGTVATFIEQTEPQVERKFVEEAKTKSSQFEKESEALKGNK